MIYLKNVTDALNDYCCWSTHDRLCADAGRKACEAMERLDEHFRPLI